MNALKRKCDDMKKENVLIYKGILLGVSMVIAISTVCALNIKFCVEPISKYEKYIMGNSGGIIIIVAQLRYMLQTSGIQNAIICIWLTYVYYIAFVKKCEMSLLTGIFAGIFTFLYLVGKSFNDAGSMDFLIMSYKYFIFSIFLGIGVYVPVYILLSVGYQKLKVT